MKQDTTFLRHHHPSVPSALDERGQTLVMALVVMLVLSISAATAAKLITSHQSASTNERQGAQAFSGGEAGLDLAANQVQSIDSDGMVLPGGPARQGTSSVGGNTVNWTAAKVGPSQWTLKSTTTSPNGRVVRSLQEEMQASVTSGTPSKIWGYGFVMGGAAPTTASNESVACKVNNLPPTTTFLGGSSSVTVPVWIEGDVCIKAGGNPAIGNPAGCNFTTVPTCAIPVHIGGTLYAEQQTCAIGAGSQSSCKSDTGRPNPVLSAFIKVCVNSITVPCDSASSGVYAGTFTPTEPTPTPKKEVLDNPTELGFYQGASPGPNNPCTTGSVPSNFFDNNTTMDTSKGSVNFLTLLGNSAFDCKTASGELKWAPGTAGAPGVLLVKGTIFIDASLVMNKNSDAIRWDPASNGSIYTNGTFTLSNNASVCATVSCTPGSDGWDPTLGPFVYLSAYNNGSSTTDGFTLSQNAVFEGEGYTNGGFSMDTTSTFAGSIFADYGDVTGNGFFAVSGTPPDGSLGSKTTRTDWSVAPRTWRQCPVTGCS